MQLGKTLLKGGELDKAILNEKGRISLGIFEVQ